MSNLINAFNSALFSPSETLLFIPGKRAFWTNITKTLTNRIRQPNESLLKNTFTFLKDLALIDIGITSIKVNGEIINPKSDPIGAKSQISYIMGAKDSIITLEFATDDYPGVLAKALLEMIEETKLDGETVFITDNLVGVRPTYIVSSEIALLGENKNVITGKIVLNSLYINKNIPLQESYALSVGATVINNLTKNLPTDGRWIANVAREIAL